MRREEEEEGGKEKKREGKNRKCIEESKAERYLLSYKNNLLYNLLLRILTLQNLA